MTDGEFLTQTIIERMDLIFRRNNKEPTEEEKAEDIRKSTEYYNKNAKPGSLAAKANMVKQYNEKN